MNRKKIKRKEEKNKISSSIRKISRKVQKELIYSLSISQNEKDVENSYRAAFEKIFPENITSPCSTDGLINSSDISSLLEFKYNLSLKNPLDYSTVLVQCLAYLKKMQSLGMVLPKSLFIGDKDECFCLATKHVKKYLLEDIDWNTAPSEMAKKNPMFVAKIAQDKEIMPFIYLVTEYLDLLSIIEKMKNIEYDKPVSVNINKFNIIEIFRCFKKDVIADKISADDKKMSELVDIFFTCLTKPDEAYLHPKKNNILILRGKDIKVNSSNFRTFFSQFKQDYTPRELEEITGNKDRIIENEYRRFTGAFFTPDIWVNEAHKMLAESLGENWKDEYVVWDCAAGTANLTRGYNFKELYISTLEDSDIYTIRDMNYNQNATVFQYDFLSEIGIESVPQELKDAFEQGKKILFFINPPYGTASNRGAKIGDHKAGIAKTKINEVMLKNEIGSSSRQLYAQFIYKISKLKEKHINVSIGTFIPPLLITGPSFKKFRDYLYPLFNFQQGMLFQASNFLDVAAEWGISFSIWNDQVAKPFDFDIKEIDKTDFIVKTIGKKTLYNTDNNSASKWVREEIKKLKTSDAPQVTSYVKVKQSGCLFGNLTKNALGYFLNNSNNVYENTVKVALFSSCYAGGNGLSIVRENLHKVIALFCARKSIKGNWINDKDEYLVPNESHEDYKQWNNDCLVYSLFNNSSQQSSLRQVDYKGKKWDIINHFFFMSQKEMLDLASDNSFNEMYQDAKTGTDRHIQTLLKSTLLSPDAVEVLVMAREMIRKAMPLRQVYHTNHPEYHLQAWDAGWAQHKPMFKEFFKEDYDKFVLKYKEFENRMREGVYKFGFLK